MTIKIEKNIPIPKTPPFKHWPFKLMEVGDSFAFQVEDRYKVQSAASACKRRNPEFNYTIKLLRIWRTEPK